AGVENRSAHHRWPEHAENSARVAVRPEAEAAGKGRAIGDQRRSAWRRDRGSKDYSPDAPRREDERTAARVGQAEPRRPQGRIVEAGVSAKPFTTEDAEEHRGSH